MDIKTRDELLLRIKNEPKFLSKLIKRYNPDLDFYRSAVSINIEAYNYVPSEYKDDDVIINILLNCASTSYLSFNYKKIIPHNDSQMEKLKNIEINICYLYLYKTIFGKEKRFNDDILLSIVSNENGVVSQINDLFLCIDEEEEYFIKYRFGLNDGCLKNLSECSKKFKTNSKNIKKLESSIIEKMRTIIKNSHLSNIGFYDEIYKGDKYVKDGKKYS